MVALRLACSEHADTLLGDGDGNGNGNGLLLPLRRKT